MSHNFQICPIDFALHGDNVPYDIFAFKITVLVIPGFFVWAKLSPEITDLISGGVPCY